MLLRGKIIRYEFKKYTIKIQNSYGRVIGGKTNFDPKLKTSKHDYGFN